MGESEAARHAATVAHGIRETTAGLARKKTTGADLVVGQVEPAVRSAPPTRVFISWAHAGESWTASETAA